MHNEWEELAKHEVISVEQIKSNPSKLISPKKLILYCSLHQDKELDLYCETCEELICLHCTVKKHRDHQYDLVVDAFATHKAEMMAAVEPIENQRNLTANAKKQLDAQLQKLDDNRDAVKADIERDIQRFQGLLEARKMKLFDDVDQHVERKKKNLETQKDELETIETQQASCLSFVKESLDAASQGEVMRVKKIAMKRVKTLADNFKQDTLSPRECANVKFIASELELACQQFGEVYLQEASSKKCYATGEGLCKAEPGERACAVLHVVNEKGEACSTPIETVTCELESETAGEKTECCLKKVDVNQFEISCQPTSEGMHLLHIKVEREQIKGSPFPVVVKLPVRKKLSAPIKIIDRLKLPCGIAIDHKDQLIVSELDAHCVSIFSPTGEKIKTFNVCASDSGRLPSPSGVAEDVDYNILVLDHSNHCIQKFTSDGKFIAKVGEYGHRQNQFKYPTGVAVNPYNVKTYVANHNMSRVEILKYDLTHFSCMSLGYGCEEWHPYDVAFDSVGNVYVVDDYNHCIRVFSARGQFLRKFGKKGNGAGELDKPNCIAIDSDDVVYVTEGSNHRVSVFMCDSEFLFSFGSKGTRPGQFDTPDGIAVNKKGVVYVVDHGNCRIQLF